MLGAAVVTALRRRHGFMPRGGGDDRGEARVRARIPALVVTGDVTWCGVIPGGESASLAWWK